MHFCLAARQRLISLCTANKFKPDLWTRLAARQRLRKKFAVILRSLCCDFSNKFVHILVRFQITFLWQNVDGVTLYPDGLGVNHASEVFYKFAPGMFGALSRPSSVRTPFDRLLYFFPPTRSLLFFYIFHSSFSGSFFFLILKLHSRLARKRISSATLVVRGEWSIKGSLKPWTTPGNQPTSAKTSKAHLNIAVSRSRDEEVFVDVERHAFDSGFVGLKETEKVNGVTRKHTQASTQSTDSYLELVSEGSLTDVEDADFSLLAGGNQDLMLRGVENRCGPTFMASPRCGEHKNAESQTTDFGMPREL